ncbi:MAG: hypothetical protein ACKVKM_10430, partial [Verrucomicrobiia bacterium]
MDKLTTHSLELVETAPFAIVDFQSNGRHLVERYLQGIMSIQRTAGETAHFFVYPKQGRHIVEILKIRFSQSDLSVKFFFKISVVT